MSVVYMARWNGWQARLPNPHHKINPRHQTERWTAFFSCSKWGPRRAKRYAEASLREMRKAAKEGKQDWRASS